MYLGIALHVENAIVLYCCKEVSEHVPLISAMKRSWRIRGKDVQALRGPRKEGTLLAPNIPFQMCSLHNQYVPSISSAKYELQ